MKRLNKTRCATVGHKFSCAMLPTQGKLHIVWNGPFNLRLNIFLLNSRRIRQNPVSVSSRGINFQSRGFVGIFMMLPAHKFSIAVMLSSGNRSFLTRCRILRDVVLISFAQYMRLYTLSNPRVGVLMFRDSVMLHVCYKSIYRHKICVTDAIMYIKTRRWVGNFGIT